MRETTIKEKAKRVTVNYVMLLIGVIIVLWALFGK